LAGTLPLVWLTSPDSDGWWVCARREKPAYLEIWLVRVENGCCFSDTGTPCGTPATVEFRGVRWLGPVQEP